MYDAVSDHAKAYIDNKYPCNSGGWIHFRVLDEAGYEDIVRILHA